MDETQKEIEGAAEYLQYHNFKSLMEWMTAEMILSRPEDPFQFIKQLMRKTIKKRLGDPYKPEDNVDLVRQCYAEASENADETGAIPGRGHSDDDEEESDDDDFFGEKKAAKKSSSSSSENVIEKVQRLEKLVSSMRDFTSTLTPEKAIGNLIEATCLLLSCDRATLFVVNPVTKELNMHTAEGNVNVKLKLGEGIAGSVAESGNILNIPDAYRNPKFDSTNDKKTGYVTKTILASPVTDSDGNTVGVIQAINKKSGEAFTKVDEEIMEIMRVQAGSALANSLLHSQLVKQKERIDAMIQIICLMNRDLGINSLLFTISTKSHSLMEADKCTLYMVDHPNEEIWTIQGDINLRFAMGKGIAGYVATKGETINLEDPYNDPRFDPAQDKKSNYKTTNMLTMPVFGSAATGDQAVVAVIQLLNKSSGPFDSEDVEFMTTFMNIVGPILEQSSLYQNIKKRSNAHSEANEFGDGSNSRSKAKGSLSTIGDAIVEGDEEES